MFGIRKKPKGKKSKGKKTATKAKKPFGGYSISFAGRKETLEEVFGRGDLTPSQMTKKLWTFIKSRRLSSK